MSGEPLNDSQLLFIERRRVLLARSIDEGDNGLHLECREDEFRIAIGAAAAEKFPCVFECLPPFFCLRIEFIKGEMLRDRCGVESGVEGGEGGGEKNALHT